MRAFRTYIFYRSLYTLQRGLPAIAGLLVYIDICNFSTLFYAISISDTCILLTHVIVVSTASVFVNNIVVLAVHFCDFILFCED